MANSKLLESATWQSRKRVLVSSIALTLILIVTLIVAWLVTQQGDVRRVELESNSNLRLIEVLGREDQAFLQPLISRDIDSISEITQEVAPARVSALFGFGAGFEFGNGEALVLHGIDPAIAQAIGVDEMKDDVIYGAGLGNEVQEILVPLLSQIGTTGVVSAEAVNMRLSFSSDVDAVGFANLASGAPGLEGFVSEETYWRIAEKMFGASKDSIVAEYDLGKVEMIPVYSSALVLVSDYAQVRDVASALENAGYSTGY